MRLIFSVQTADKSPGSSLYAGEGLTLTSLLNTEACRHMQEKGIIFVSQLGSQTFNFSVYLTLKVLVTTIDALETLLNRKITAQWEGMGDVGSARYEPALLPPMPDHKGFKLQ